MKKLLTILAIASIIGACNNATDETTTPDTSSSTTVDTLSPAPDTSAMRSDTSNASGAIKK